MMLDKLMKYLWPTTNGTFAGAFSQQFFKPAPQLRKAFGSNIGEGNRKKELKNINPMWQCLHCYLQYADWNFGSGIKKYQYQSLQDDMVTHLLKGILR